MAKQKGYEQYNFAVFAAQGGGLVRRVGNAFIFVEAPNCPGLEIGDEMPKEWDFQPVNKLAQQDCEEHRGGF